MKNVWAVEGKGTAYRNLVGNAAPSDGGDDVSRHIIMFLTYRCSRNNQHSSIPFSTVYTVAKENVLQIDCFVVQCAYVIILYVRSVYVLCIPHMEICAK